MIRSKWLVLGAAIGCFSGVVVAACGSSTTGTTSTSGPGGGSTSGGGTSAVTTSAATTGGLGGAAATSTSAADSSSASTGGSSSASSGTGVAPCSPPSKLIPPKADAGAQTLYCPFSGADGGPNVDCNPGTEHCCEPKMGEALCEPTATPCADPKATDWHCEDPIADCPTGQVCCGTGTLMKNTDPMCANFASGFKGTHCAASCTATEIEMCTDDAECGAGKTCLPFRTKGAQVGGCN